MAKHRLLANTVLGTTGESVAAFVAAEPPLLRDTAECRFKVLVHINDRAACMAWLHEESVVGYYDELRRSTYVNEMSFSDPLTAFECKMRFG